MSQKIKIYFKSRYSAFLVDEWREIYHDPTDDEINAANVKLVKCTYLITRHDSGKIDDKKIENMFGLRRFNPPEMLLTDFSKLVMKQKLISSVGTDIIVIDPENLMNPEKGENRTWIYNMLINL